MHNFRTGIFNSKKRKSGDLHKFFMNPTDPQLNILHEIAIQHLGHSPSSFFGHQVVPWKFNDVPKHVFSYVAAATRQPRHEFQRRMMDTTDTAKHAAGWVSTAGRVISDAVEAGAGYVNSAAQFLAKHQTTIDSAAHLANIGASLATIGGLIQPSTANRIHSGISGLSKPKKKVDKSGEGWKDFD
jgi:hypothetical protein